jgi:hypothetical protein
MRLAAAAAALALASSPAGAQAPASPSPGTDQGAPSSPPPAQPAPEQSAPPSSAPKTPQQPAPHAQKPPPAAASDLARALLTADQWGKILDSYASSLSAQVTQALQGSGEKVPDDLRAKIRAELEKSLPYRETVEAQAQALAKELTPDELKKTAAFYKSAVGKRVLDRLPEAQSSVARQLQSKLSSAVPQIVSRVAPKALQGSPHGGPAEGAPGSQGPVQGRKPPPTTAQ